MQLEFDPDKNESNFVKHGLFLAAFEGFDGPSSGVIDDRFTYGEVRVRIYGLINGRPHCVVATKRDGVVRLISFRRARMKEYRRYA